LVINLPLTTGSGTLARTSCNPEEEEEEEEEEQEQEQEQEVSDGVQEEEGDEYPCTRLACSNETAR
jgi:hypothetical protein